MELRRAVKHRADSRAIGRRPRRHAQSRAAVAAGERAARQPPRARRALRCAGRRGAVQSAIKRKAKQQNGCGKHGCLILGLLNTRVGQGNWQRGWAQPRLRRAGCVSGRRAGWAALCWQFEARRRPAAAAQATVRARPGFLASVRSNGLRLCVWVCFVVSVCRRRAQRTSAFRSLATFMCV